MLPNSSGPPLRISLVVPRSFIQAILVVACATATVTTVLPIAPALRGILLFIVVAATAWTVVWRFHERYQFGYAFVVVDTEGGWWLERPSGMRNAIRLCKDTVVHPRLVILNMKQLDQRESVNVILWAEQCGYTVFRQLCVRLSCGSTQ